MQSVQALDIDAGAPLEVAGIVGLGLTAGVDGR
jgi:hypothetical protein